MTTSEDDMDIDPAIAEAMGFSGFGMQTTATKKKRKHGDSDAFAVVDVAPAPAHQGSATGSNAVAVSRQAPKASSKAPQQGGSEAARDSSSAAPATGADGRPTLEALRHGVRNERGDMAYFLPSFIEDPWEGLAAR